MNKGFPIFALIIFLIYYSINAQSSLAGTAPINEPIIQTTGEILKTLTLNFNAETVIQDRFSSIRDERFNNMVDWIKKNDPDIIFIQEGWNYHGQSSVIIPIADAVNYDYVYRVGVGIPLVLADSNGILVKKSLHLSQKNNFELPYGKYEIGNGNHWVLPFGANSYAVGGRITLQDGSPMYIYSTHLISNKDIGAVAGLKKIHTAITTQASKNGEDTEQVKSIIAGDFNSNPDAPGPIAIRELGYQDTFADAHPNLGSDESTCTNCMDPSKPYFNPMTVSPFQFPKQVTLGGSDRFDYIMVHGPNIKTLASTVVFTQPINNVWMSDHNGVFSTIAIGTINAAYSNPVRDSIHIDKTRIIHLNSDLFNCNNKIDCKTMVSDSNVSASMGITFINETKGLVHLKINGSGRVWNQNHITLAPKEVAAFYFDPDHTYYFYAHELFTRRRVFGAINALEKN